MAVDRLFGLDEMKKESWVVFSGKDNRPSAPGKGFILEVRWGRHSPFEKDKRIKGP